MVRRTISDTVLLSGWLFADLFLGLTVIFLAALPASQPIVYTQTLIATSTILSSNSPECSGAVNNYQCTITIGVSANSKGIAAWSGSSDINDSINFSPASGQLAPKQSTQVTISAIPCQNGSFTFAGNRTTTPVTILWKCTLQPERLDLEPQDFQLNVSDVQGLLNNSPDVITDLKNQIGSVSWLQGRSVGLAIAYAGAPDDSATPQAQLVSAKIYDVLRSVGGPPFQRASYYDDLYKLGTASNIVFVDVFLFKQG